MPIFVLLLVGVFVADSYEKRMDQQIKISKNSSAFFKSREIILSVAIFIMFTLSFFADLIISGTLHQSKYSTSSLQSVWQFDLAPLMLTVRGTIIWLYVTRLMSAFYNLRHFRACGKASALCEKICYADLWADSGHVRRRTLCGSTFALYVCGCHKRKWAA